MELQLAYSKQVQYTSILKKSAKKTKKSTKMVLSHWYYALHDEL
jgi:hypothetical protein